MNLSCSKKDFGLFYYEKKYSHIIFFQNQTMEDLPYKKIFCNHSFSKWILTAVYELKIIVVLKDKK